MFGKFRYKILRSMQYVNDNDLVFALCVQILLIEVFLSSANGLVFLVNDWNLGLHPLSHQEWKALPPEQGFAQILKVLLKLVLSGFEQVVYCPLPSWNARMAGNSRKCTLKTQYSKLFSHPLFQLAKIPIRDWNPNISPVPNLYIFAFS